VAGTGRISIKDGLAVVFGKRETINVLYMERYLKVQLVFSRLGWELILYITLILLPGPESRLLKSMWSFCDDKFNAFIMDYLYFYLKYKKLANYF
jgi:hypothetical protein